MLHWSVKKTKNYGFKSSFIAFKFIHTKSKNSFQNKGIFAIIHMSLKGVILFKTWTNTD